MTFLLPDTLVAHMHINPNVKGAFGIFKSGLQGMIKLQVNKARHAVTNGVHDL